MITTEYKEQLAKLHDKKSFGQGGGKIPSEVAKILDAGEVTSLLDFGCGKGKFSEQMKEHYPNIKLYSYDPITSPIELPDEVDMIYSSDVIEHIEPDLLQETLSDLFARATKAQYHLIACHPAKKSLPDGRNAHLIIEKPGWWQEKLLEVSSGWEIIYEDIEEKTVQPKKGPPIEVIKYIVAFEKEDD